MAERAGQVLLPALILAQAGRSPDAPAVRQWSRTLTYRELVTSAGGLAAQLSARGAGPESRIGICTPRTPDMVVAVLAVLLSGAAYVPLEPSHPRRRCLDIVEDAGVGLVVADAAGRDLLGECGVHYLEVPVTGPILDPASVGPGPARPDNVVHVLYTSGSTGRPKGVLTTYANLTAFVTRCGSWAGGVGPQMRALGIASLNFDATSLDLFVPLAAGGCVQLVGDRDRADPARLQRFLAEHRVSWGFATPAVLSLIDPTGLPDFEVAICGGDVVPPHLVELWTSRPGQRFLNMYGPTEATVGSIATALTGRWTEPVPIGRALPGQPVYLLDRRGAPVGVGVEGELHVGGAGVARGYLGKPGMTAERFLPDPFAGEPGARMYRTGDLARRLPDGDIVYLGRRDGQLKIRGQRIELGEIEASLRAHPRVDDAAVVAVTGAGGPLLVGFVAPVDGPDGEQLRAFASERLTPAMVPRRVERLARLPLTASGKLDRDRLRALAGQRAGTAAAPDGPGTAAAPDGGGEVAGLWRQVLGGGTPSATDDFFDVGGHSIAAMRLVAAIRQELRRDISVEDVFYARTLAGLAQRVGSAAPLTGRELTAGNPPALAPSQRRMWFLDKLAPQLTAYNILFAERLRGPLDARALRAALSAVARRHDILRWRILDSGGEPYAVCDPPTEVPLAAVPLAEADLADVLAATAARPFDLAEGPLWTATLYRLGETDHVLALSLHHSIVDGWSQAQLYADLGEAYAKAVRGQPAQLPALPFGYADYVAWLADRDLRDGPADRRWWSERLADAPPVLDLPRDRPRPPVQTYAGALTSVAFGDQLEAGVRELAHTLGATPSQVVLAALGQALRRLTGAVDLVIGAINADRGLAAMQQAVGFFVDMIPLRLRVDDRAGFAAAVRDCRAEYLAATGHPAAPLERIVDDLGLPRDPSRPPLVQVIFNVYNFDEARLRLPGVDATPLPVSPAGSPFDLTVYLLERDGTQALDLLYNRDLYDDTRMRRLAGDLVALLTELVCHPDKPVAELTTRLRTDGAVDDGPVLAASPPVAAGYDAEPATPTERLVADVWRTVLALPQVRATDNFFDVGGHSLALVAVQTRLVELLGRPLPVVDLFRHPSVRALAAYLDGAAQSPELARAAQVAAARRSRTRRRRPT